MSAKPRIVVVGAGFAGFHAAKRLTRLAAGAAEVIVLNPTDYFLYLPLLPKVATGLLEPRRICVGLSGALPGTRLVLGDARSIDLNGRRVTYVDPEGSWSELRFDRLVVSVGSVNKLLPIPGVAEHAHGFRGIPEALYLRDHIVKQIEMADNEPDPARRVARCTFVVVGAGYTGTEVAAHGQLFTDELATHHPRLARERPQWMLLDVAPRVLPELDPRLSEAADQVLRERGVEVRMGTSIEEAMAGGVKLSNGRFVPTRSLIWCVGVRPDPLVKDLGLPTEKGRLLVDEYLNIPGYPHAFACGDAAAVPDLTRPGEYTPMTAQHAVRQGKLVARNIAASYRRGTRKPYKHHDLGFAVDLGGVQAAANPLKLPLSGLPAAAVTAGYHLIAMPGNRIRVATDLLLNAALPRQTVQLGLVPSGAVSLTLETAEPEHIHSDS
jgi:NADH dehydrogenase